MRGKSLRCSSQSLCEAIPQPRRYDRILKYGEETRNQRFKNIRLEGKAKNSLTTCCLDPRYHRTFLRTLAGEWKGDISTSTEMKILVDILRVEKVVSLTRSWRSCV